MQKVQVTELRGNLPAYLHRVQEGEELIVMSRGKAVARLLPIGDERLNARRQLEALRSKCRMGDVVNPVAEIWESNT